jgi:hypothetical protein
MDFLTRLTVGDVLLQATPDDVAKAGLARDKAFYDSLGPGASDRPSRRPGCSRWAVSLSVECRPHHFEMVFGRPCPFND